MPVEVKVRRLPRFLRFFTYLAPSFLLVLLRLTNSRDFCANCLANLGYLHGRFIECQGGLVGEVFEDSFYEPLFAFS